MYNSLKCLQDNKGKCSKLLITVWVSIIELSTLLLNQKADLTIATTSGDTILHAGVYGNNSTIVDLLLAAGKSFSSVA